MSIEIDPNNYHLLHTRAKIYTTIYMRVRLLSRLDDVTTFNDSLFDSKFFKDFFVSSEFCKSFK